MDVTRGASGLFCVRLRLASSVSVGDQSAAADGSFFTTLHYSYFSHTVWIFCDTVLHTVPPPSRG